MKTKIPFFKALVLVVSLAISTGCSTARTSSVDELPSSILPPENHLTVPAYDGESPYAVLPNNGEGSFV